MSFRNVLTITMTVVAACICVILATLPALAADCPRGTLDKQYCDRNGDLVADLPLDEKDWVNPSTIIFSYTPVEDPAIYAKVWDGFVKHLSEVTDRMVSEVLVRTSSDERNNDAMAAPQRIDTRHPHYGFEL